MVLKTREKLIEVARQLFAHKGIENTTMSDIANASDKGRRTIYTYFKNKREIYNAVIERESEHLVERLRDIAESSDSATDKLIRFIDVRLQTVRETISHQPDSPMFRTLFIREVKRMERIRNMAIEKEFELIQNILNEGLRTNEFSEETASCVYTAMLMIFQGIELSYMRNNFSQMHLDSAKVGDQLKEFILNAIQNK
ncbi:MAG: TetR/AcrR family transcriptional regulator [Muribaculum sp.]|nr:TetR/AcrR family transcriptional regulator [Muribaculum sp.]